MSGSPSPQRPLLTGLLIVALGVLLLEVLLQVLAFGVALTTRNSSVAGGSDAEQTILCIGDSYTFGVGASGPHDSYPGHLERLLNERDGAGKWQVHNTGFPGKHSASMLRELSQQLGSIQPDYVVVIAGANDTWAQPDKVTPEILAEVAGDSRTSKFRWEFRLGKLIKTLRRPDAFRKDNVEQLVDLEEIEADPEEMLVLSRIRDDQEALRIEVSAIRARKQGDLARAEELYRSLPSTRKANTMAGLIWIYSSQGRREEAQQTLAELRQMADAPDLQVHQAEVIAEGLVRAAFYQEGIETVAKLSGRFPESFALAYNQTITLQNLGRTDEAMTKSDDARRLGLLEVNAENPWRPWFFRVRAGIFKESDPAVTAEAVAVAFESDNDVLLAQQTLRFQGFNVTEEQWQEAVESNPRLDEAQKKVLAPALALANKGSEVGDNKGYVESPFLDVLQYHLTTLASLGAESGARVVFASYPFGDEQLAKIQSEAAAGTDMPYIRCDQAMDKALKTREWDDLFIRDGHCNGAGYEVMAKAVLEGIPPVK